MSKLRALVAVWSYFLYSMLIVIVHRYSRGRRWLIGDFLFQFVLVLSVAKILLPFICFEPLLFENEKRYDKNAFCQVDRANIRRFYFVLLL